ncbi:hypothetical protein [Litoribacillus peritrichatus]|uniref:Uncharacterized protein n=1 Tax=Litoribacillus peritrichatus TaxID=718191 RepID=A0ABP7N0E2_9GAMM
MFHGPLVFIIAVYLYFGVLFFISHSSGQFEEDLIGLQKKEQLTNLLALLLVSIASWWVVLAMKTLHKKMRLSV